jgi:hypothetical protein
LAEGAVEGVGKFVGDALLWPAADAKSLRGWLGLLGRRVERWEVLWCASADAGGYTGSRRSERVV